MLVLALTNRAILIISYSPNEVLLISILKPYWVENPQNCNHNRVINLAYDQWLSCQKICEPVHIKTDLKTEYMRYSLSCQIQRCVGRVGVKIPWKFTKLYGSLGMLGVLVRTPRPWKITKLTSQHSMFGHHLNGVSLTGQTGQ